MAETSLGFRIATGLVGTLAPWLLRLLYSTCRILAVNPEADRTLVRARPIIGAVYHKHFLFHSYFFRRRRCVIMVSRSKDGEIVSRVLDRLGFVPVRGSSSRGGWEALRELIDYLRQGYMTALITDGPRGPAGVSKIGAVRAAQESGHPVVPFAVVAEKAFEFRNWDRTAIPHPWSRIAVKYGEPIFVPADASEERCEEFRRGIDVALSRMEAELKEFLARSGKGKS